MSEGRAPGAPIESLAGNGQRNSKRKAQNVKVEARSAESKADKREAQCALPPPLRLAPCASHSAPRTPPLALCALRSAHT